MLFLELLRKLDAGLPVPISQYKYVGLGGPYLEDFTALHGAFEMRRMTSLEVKEHVFSRQRINQPHSQVRLTLDSTTDYVEHHRKGPGPQLVWFDYEWQDWRNQIAESCDLLRQLPLFSIFKISLSGKTDWLVESTNDPLPLRAQKLQDLFPDSGPFEENQITREHICDTLYQICHRAIADAVPDSHARSVRTLAAYWYDDGTPMLTITLLIAPITDIEALIDDCNLRKWPFADIEWSGAKNIAVPHLSVREKLAIDRLLPRANTRTVLKKLKVRFDEEYWKSYRTLSNYIRFHRHVPAFMRVSI
jgi:hypothetical protein